MSNLMGRGLTEALQADAPRQELIRERLCRAQEATQKRLEKLTQAIKFIDDNPSFETFHDIITTAGIY